MSMFPIAMKMLGITAIWRHTSTSARSFSDGCTSMNKFTKRKVPKEDRRNVVWKICVVSFPVSCPWNPIDKENAKHPHSNQCILWISRTHRNLYAPACWTNRFVRCALSINSHSARSQQTHPSPFSTRYPNLLPWTSSQISGWTTL